MPIEGGNVLSTNTIKNLNILEIFYTDLIAYHTVPTNGPPPQKIRT